MLYVFLPYQIIIVAIIQLWGLLRGIFVSVEHPQSVTLFDSQSHVVVLKLLNREDDHTPNMMLSWFFIISINLILRGIPGSEVVMAFTPPISFSSSLTSFAIDHSIQQQQRGRFGTNDISHMFSRFPLQKHAGINNNHLSAHAPDSQQGTITISNHVKVGRNTYYRTGSKDSSIMNNNKPVPPPNTNDDQSNNSDIISPDIIPSAVFDRVVNARYACTRFLRHKEPEIMPDNNNNSTSIQQQQQQPNASVSNPSIIQKAQTCLSLSTRSPTGFNAQPYRIILVHTKQQKEEVAQYCLGRNADRVRDSDCTAIFLADRECGRDGDRFVKFLMNNMDNNKESSSSNDNGGDDEKRSEISSSSTSTTKTTSRTRRTLSSKALLKLRLLILLFSSGYPLPQLLSKPISFCIRLGVSILSFFTRTLYTLKLRYKLFNKILPNNIQLLPTLTSSTTWSQKNTMLVAMTYMLGCTSNGLATCPMEGYDATGICKVLKIPRGRFTIPIIVSTGMPYHSSRQSESASSEGEEEETDDVGLSHGSDMSPRYPLEEVVFGNTYGVQL